MLVNIPEAHCSVSLSQAFSIDENLKSNVEGDDGKVFLSGKLGKDGDFLQYSHYSKNCFRVSKLIPQQCTMQH